MIEVLDSIILKRLKKIHQPLARVSLFVVFFWFGFLKLFGLSPANDLVESLLSIMLPGVPFAIFIVVLGALEMIIGILFVIPRFGRVVIPLLLVHLATTFLPLFLLPHIAWQAPFVPTLEGQYIIKNIVIASLALAVGAHFHPMRRIEESSE